ncbi:MAG TPA: YraN family protein [Roseiflexaceae bacterium]|nr:YraN family protein [Roseiflexaceae bacterium]HMP42793.1 YraN family protein [Roseiflexaceae bacterium]
MADQRNTLGAFGEQAAASYLIRAGYSLVARRWRCAVGELDLIMCDGETLVFVEVRTRRAAAAHAAESVGPAKRRRLIDLAHTYLAETAAEQPWRIDVVAVSVDPHGRAAILHIPYAVEA